MALTTKQPGNPCVISYIPILHQSRVKSQALFIRREMVAGTGVEPVFAAYETAVLTVGRARHKMEPAQGIGPWFSPYERDVIPLYHTGEMEPPRGFAPPYGGLQNRCCTIEPRGQNQWRAGVCDRHPELFGPSFSHAIRQDKNGAETRLRSGVCCLPCSRSAIELYRQARGAT